MVTAFSECISSFVRCHNSAPDKRQHETQYFIDDIDDGWRRDADGTLMINPVIYSVQIEDAFRRRRLYQTFTAQPALQLLQLKYKFIRQWLELDKADTISQQIQALDKLDATADINASDVQIRSEIYKRYGL